MRRFKVNVVRETMELYEIIFVSGMVGLLVGCALYLGWKYRARVETQATAHTPLLSWGLFLSLILFVVFVTSFSILMFTARHSPDEAHSFAIRTRGGGKLYTHPVLGVLWIASLIGAGASGVLNLISFCWYSRKEKLNSIRVPGLGAVEMEE